MADDLNTLSAGMPYPAIISTLWQSDVQYTPSVSSNEVSMVARRWQQWISTAAMLLVVVLVTGTASAQEETFTGTLNGDFPNKDYQIQLAEGQTILATASAISGDLDAYLELYDPEGDIVSENDDRGSDTLDSALAYTVLETGTYMLRVRRYEPGDSSGQFELVITIGDESLFDVIGDGSRPVLSGATLTLDTKHFRVHYTLNGNDATTQEYVNALGVALEEIWVIQIEQLGWLVPPSDGTRGGNSLYDIYLVNLLGNGDGTYGYSSPETQQIVDNPATPLLEEFGAPSHIVIENDFDERSDSSISPISLMRTTAAHEFHHAIQFGYEVLRDYNWFYYEATASWMETVTFFKDQDVLSYTAEAFNYPDVCFGSTQLEYGTWMFLESLTDAHGSTVVRELWENIARYDGFAALENTLSAYGDSLTDAVSRYYLQNLVRDYDLAPQFSSTVWHEARIDGLGRWTFSGEGIQELGANYYDFAMPPGRYSIDVAGNGALRLWVVGIKGDNALIAALNKGGTVDTTGYENVMLMVFNPTYDDDPFECTYSGYTLDVRPPSGPLAPFDQTMSAEYFAPLQ